MKAPPLALSQTTMTTSHSSAIHPGAAEVAADIVFVFVGIVIAVGAVEMGVRGMSRLIRNLTRMKR
jgi:hypothetical protein